MTLDIAHLNKLDAIAGYATPGEWEEHLAELRNEADAHRKMVALMEALT